ncbi:transcriptional activator FtrA [compost metagenome]
MDDVIQCRIRLAKEKLIYGPQRIADIAALCGYTNVEHFSRQFRQLTGQSPRTFRKSAEPPR